MTYVPSHANELSKSSFSIVFNIISTLVNVSPLPEFSFLINYVYAFHCSKSAIAIFCGRTITTLLFYYTYLIRIHLIIFIYVPIMINCAALMFTYIDVRS